MNVQPRDVPWTGTGGISDAQSYSWIILNAIYDRIAASSLFQDYAVKRITRAMPIEAGYQIPFIGIYLGNETATPDGDANAGDIRFIHTVPVGVQIVVKNNDSVEMQQTLDRAKWFFLNQLLRDNTFTNRLHTTMPDGVTIEGFPRLRIPSPDWGRDSKNEVPLGMQLIELTYTLRTEWFPTEFDDLKSIGISAYPVLEYEPVNPEEIENIKVEIRFDPDYVPPPYTGPGP
jgi:hypothetical protein